MKLQAAFRLRAFLLNKIKTTDPALAAELKYFQDDFANTAFFRKYYVKLKRIGTTDYYARKDSSRNSIVAVDGEELVGYINCLPLENEVDQVYVAPKHQGKRVGVGLYETLVKKLGKLRSSYSLSVGSSAMWAYLCKKHKGVFVVTDSDDKVYRLKPIDYVKESDGGTYPVFTVNGKPTSLRHLSGKGTSESRTAALNGYYEIKK